MFLTRHILGFGILVLLLCIRFILLDVLVSNNFNMRLLLNTIYWALFALNDNL